MTNQNYYNELLHERDAALFLKLSIHQMRRWRCNGGGPAYIRVGGKNGRAIRYRKPDIDAYIEANRHGSGDSMS